MEERNWKGKQNVWWLKRQISWQRWKEDRRQTMADKIVFFYLTTTKTETETEFKLRQDMKTEYNEGQTRQTRSLCHTRIIQHDVSTARLKYTLKKHSPWGTDNDLERYEMLTTTAWWMFIGTVQAELQRILGLKYLCLTQEGLETETSSLGTKQQAAVSQSPLCSERTSRTKWDILSSSSPSRCLCNYNTVFDSSHIHPYGAPKIQFRQDWQDIFNEKHYK